MAKLDINPFERSALRDFKLMAGRDEEFKHVRFILRNASRQKTKFRNIMITGDRGVGKTSFLNLIENECEANKLIPIRLNLTENNTKNSNDFFWALFSQTIETILNIGFLEGKGGSIDTSIQKILNEENIPELVNWVYSMPIQHKNYCSRANTTFEFDKLIEDLKKLRTSVISENDELFGENVKFLYLVDESHHLYSKETIVQEIRFIVQNQEIGIGFIFAGDNSYQTKAWENVFGGSYREFDIIKLDYFKEPDDVVSFFKKSLTSVDFTDDEIKEKLFFRFYRTCFNIFRLSSGKPELINRIACKMFDRLMKGEVSKLNFDTDTQSEVKIMLENSGQLDGAKLDFIDKLPSKYKKWLAKIFASQLHWLDKVYFYGKFHLNNDNLISESEFKRFCQDLIERGIITLLERGDKNTEKNESNILLTPYFSFEASNDTTKHWLQISSNGFYKFGFTKPQELFFLEINNNLCMELNTGTYINTKEGKDEIRFSQIITAINVDKFEIENIDFYTLRDIYFTCKKVIKSNERFALFGKLLNHTSGTTQFFNTYTYDEKGKLVPFHDSQIAKDKFINAVASYNSDKLQLSLEIYIDKLQCPNIEKLQRIILLSNDRKKQGIIKDDKMTDLLEFYVNKSNKQESHKIADFFYELFENGHDLTVRELNNTAYVLMENGEIEKANQLIYEGERKVYLDYNGREEIEVADRDAAALILYNSGILHIMQSNTEAAIKKFNYLLDYIDQKNILDTEASVLKVVEVNSKSEFKIAEVKSIKNDTILDFKECAKENIKTLKDNCLSTKTSY